MDRPNFHDGYFDGFRIDSGDAVTIFLRTGSQGRFELPLHGVGRAAISGARRENIILDLVLKNARDATLSDVGELFDINQRMGGAEQLLESTREKQLQILELNPSYGAQGLFLFASFDLRTVGDPGPCQSL